MIKLLLLFALLYVHCADAQILKQLDGKWAFTGLRTTIFKVQNNELYVGMLEYTDTSNFNRFLEALPPDSTVFTKASTLQENDTIAIQVQFPAIDHSLQLIYATKNPMNILFTGDVFFDSTKAITANNNCNLNNPGCINRLYNASDLKAMLHLNNYTNFTRDDAFEFLLRLNETLKTRCNKCYAGFTDSYMNEVLINMGFNPIIKRSAVGSTWYNTSGFNSYIKAKFASDQRIVKLTDYIFDWYLK